ncbi:hypothetical protein GOP47_0008224 [Adiantum capillus-veneris]|uniref:Uncharacterized protein n=1 Tax=Adiantum capillus-veneris TaxID=13818 RepID=A0A9D4UY52_ADICA|nr:hypothetical protein GOP47_0008224 [Adiantum capillus-veneris]
MAVGRWQTFLPLKCSSTVQRVRHAGGRLCLSTSAAAGEWEGLQAWRVSSVDERRIWGPKNTKWGALVLNTPDPLLKASISHHAFRLWSNHQLPLGVANAPDRPARPDKPPLVPLKQVPDVRNSPLPRNAHVLHILAHIELNAVDLAWDTVVRFSGDSQVLGHQFFSDFAHVADDESRHFSWCAQRLSELGFQYGDMAAHDMLVGEGQKSATNVMARLAVVPMVQEARGLDSGPRLAGRLVGWGDVRSASIVNQIAEEELAHVAVGVSWFLTVCKMIDRVPDKTFRDLIQELNVELKGPFNHAAREKAGLPRSWYEPDAGLSDKVQEPSISSGGVQVINLEVSRSSVWTALGWWFGFCAIPVVMPLVSRESCQRTIALQCCWGLYLKEVYKAGINGHCSLKETGSTSLAEVYKRLEFLIAMEKERAA